MACFSFRSFLSFFYSWKVVYKEFFYTEKFEEQKDRRADENIYRQMNNVSQILLDLGDPLLSNVDGRSIQTL